MAPRSDSFDIGRLGLRSGEGRSLDLDVPVERLILAGQPYDADPGEVPVRLDVSRTTSGYAFRLRFEARLAGPCMRCLEPAGRTIDVDAREVDQPGDDTELSSPYLEGDELDLRAWARDALAVALPAQIVCHADCRGLCAICGVNLNEAGPGHRHEREPDPRWAKLSELEFD